MASFLVWYLIQVKWFPFEATEMALVFTPIVIEAIVRGTSSLASLDRTMVPLSKTCGGEPRAENNCMIMALWSLRAAQVRKLVYTEMAPVKTGP